jgi:pimeloyl-ACP methyl ester carboxylesterase
MTIHHFTSGDGVRLAYEEFGEGNGGTPLVFCHGIAVNGIQFHEDAAWFAARGHRVLVPHLRGHGLSDSPVPVSRETLTIERLAADLVEMLDDAGADKVHWVGNSLGGIVALEMLKAQRFATLTTFGTSYAIQLPVFGARLFVPLWHRSLGRRAAAGVAAHFTSTDTEARRFIDMMLRDMRIEVVAAIGANLTWYDLIERGTSATLPILMLYCGRDRLVNIALWETLRKMRGKPNFHKVDLPKGGHCANLEFPDEFRAALVEFWASVAAHR